MHLPHFLSVKRIRDDKVFGEARGLALLRLEQCIADFRIPALSKRRASGLAEDSAAEKTHPPRLMPLRQPPNSQGALDSDLKSCCTVTVTEEIINSLRANSGRLMRVTFSDGVVQKVIIDGVDNAGFLHHGFDGADSQLFWTRFEDVNALEAGN